MPLSLSELIVYPIKSIQGVAQHSCTIGDTGLLGDRQYMLINSEGEFVSGRTCPSLVLITATALNDGGWQLSHPSVSEPLIFNKDSLTQQYKNVFIWDDALQAQMADSNINEWFSRVVEDTVELVFFGDKSKRFTGRRPEKSVAFADGYPLLLTTQASLDMLNESCPEEVQMARFRPNLVVSGSEPFIEDSWKRIRIGEVEFENVKPCERCIFITIDPKTAERSKKGEPLKTLGKFRLQKGKGINFGINLISLTQGSVHLDDPVEILEYREPEEYEDRRR